MDRKIAKALIDKYLAGQCTPEEQAQVETWYNQLAAQQKDKSELPDYEARNMQIKAGLPSDPSVTLKVVRFWPRIAAAASILLCLGLGFYYNQKHQSKPSDQMAHNDIAPGSNKAIITLTNGRRIILTGAKNGYLALQGNTAIKKKADGQVIYDAHAGTANASAEVAYNTVSTPRGGQYQVVLPDGSHVWLNAASSIRFPTIFTGKDREVAITGEVYFEVSHNPNKPFKVSNKGQTIEVLGTHFNVSAYEDEPATVTTLLEGSVKLAFNHQNILLKPGQACFLKNDNGQFMVRKANLKNAVAWKDGFFQFEQTDLKTMMRQISRWYDLDIVYQGNIPNDEFDGQVPRNTNLIQMLKILGSNEVHYKIETGGYHNQLIIRP